MNGDEQGRGTVWVGFSLAPSPQPQTQRSWLARFTCGCSWDFLLYSIIYLFVYFWPCWVFVAVWPSSRCGKRGYPLVAACGLLIAVASLIAEQGLSGAWTSVAADVGSVAVAPGRWSTGSEVWHLGLVALWPEGSSQTRDRTQVPCIGRQFLNLGPPGKSSVLTSESKNHEAKKQKETLALLN